MKFSTDSKTLRNGLRSLSLRAIIEPTEIFRFALASLDLYPRFLIRQARPIKSLFSVGSHRQNGLSKILDKLLYLHALGMQPRKPTQKGKDFICLHFLVQFGSHELVFNRLCKPGSTNKYGRRGFDSMLLPIDSLWVLT